MRNWSYGVLEREVRANLVYRDFTRVGGTKMAQHHLGRGARSAAGAALGMSLGQGLVDRRRNVTRCSLVTATSAALISAG
jgi:hypothetical protein